MVSEPATLDNYDSFFEGQIVAAADIDGDGFDELIVTATYYEGANYKVFSSKNARMTQVYNSFYVGM